MQQDQNNNIKSQYSIFISDYNNDEYNNNNSTDNSLQLNITDNRFDQDIFTFRGYSFISDSFYSTGFEIYTLMQLAICK